MTAEDARERLPDLGKARDAASAEVAAITKAAEELRRGEEAPSSSELAKQARDLIALAALGRQLGLQDGHCPLCGTDQDNANYQQGVATAENIAKSLDPRAVKRKQHDTAGRPPAAHTGNAPQ